MPLPPRRSMSGGHMPGKTPRNKEGQKPTRNAGETAKRLDEKASDQKGGSNKRRTEEKARRTRPG
ncbi:hypothetical protein BH18CHL2_BH18CHL2_06960 [soil metagenome]